MCVKTSQNEISGKNSHLLSQKVFIRSLIYPSEKTASSILAWGTDPPPLFLHYVSTILNITDQLSIVCCCCFFKSYFCTFSVFVHFSLSNKTVHGPGPWQGVHGPGPWKWSMDRAGPCFVLSQKKQAGPCFVLSQKKQLVHLK